MTVTDGELQIVLEVGRESVRKNIQEVTEARLQSVFAWTREFGVPVLPLSAAEDTTKQIQKLMGQVPLQQNPAANPIAPGAALG